VKQHKMSLVVLLLLTAVAVAMTGLFTLSGLHVSNDYVTLLPPAVSWGIVLILSALVLILSHICRCKGASSVGVEVTTFVSTICLLCAAWGWRYPLVKYVGNFREGVACAEANGASWTERVDGSSDRNFMMQKPSPKGWRKFLCLVAGGGSPAAATSTGKEH